MATTADLRTRLLDAAEELLFERGVDGFSLREIGVRAGSKNASAVQYHLGDRAGVVRAVLQRHHPEVEARRHALLDEIEAGGAPELRALAGAYVRPLAAELDVAPGYLQVLSDLVTRPEPALEWVVDPELNASTTRWRAMVEPLLAPSGVQLHRRFTAMQFAHIALAQRARRDADVDQRLFTSHLVDLVAALLAAPVSPETERLRSARRRAG